MVQAFASLTPQAAEEAEHEIRAMEMEEYCSVLRF